MSRPKGGDSVGDGDQPKRSENGKACLLREGLLDAVPRDRSPDDPSEKDCVEDEECRHLARRLRVVAHLRLEALMREPSKVPGRAWHAEEDDEEHHNLDQEETAAGILNDEEARVVRSKRHDGILCRGAGESRFMKGLTHLLHHRVYVVAGIFIEPA